MILQLHNLCPFKVDTSDINDDYEIILKEVFVTKPLTEFIGTE